MTVTGVTALWLGWHSGVSRGRKDPGELRAGTCSWLSVNVLLCGRALSGPLHHGEAHLLFSSPPPSQLPPRGLRRGLPGSDLQYQDQGHGPQPALEVGEGQEVSSPTVPGILCLLCRRLECERGTGVLPTETWVSVSPGMRRDHQCLLGWGDSCSLVSSPHFPTSSFSFPSFKRRECPWGLQLLCSPHPQGRGQINGSCVEPDWGCYSEGRKPDDSREGVCSGWGGGADTPEGWSWEEA